MSKTELKPGWLKDVINTVTLLPDHEWTLIWASLRYFVGRATAASASYPVDIIKHYYPRLSAQQRLFLAEDIRRYLQEHGQIGHKTIDEPRWLKFAAALDTDEHFEVVLADGSKHRVFAANDRIYPLEQYLAAPALEVYIPDSHIKAVNRPVSGGLFTEEM